MMGLYIHIPFCVQKCLYCDFPSYGGVLKRYGSAYAEALCREIRTCPHQGEMADTVYFGGGTPSLFSGVQIGNILRALRDTFCITADAEITLEANPDSIDRGYADELAALGFNRISIGMQSAQNSMLRFLGRVHTAEQGIQAVQDVYDSGIHNISVDFMYGLPGQTVHMVQTDMAILQSLPVVHASVYRLIVEEGTMLKRGIAMGKYVLPDEETAEEMTNAVHAGMRAGGFHHYEISSYCRDDFASRHNIKYWRYVPYIGFGASAHSFDGDVRWMNMANLAQYIRRAGYQSVRAEETLIDKKRAVEDYCFLALRMREGIHRADFAAHFGRPPEEEFAAVLETLLSQGLLEETAYGYRMTALGLSYGNYVFSRFIR